jgi:hypothetical protein
MIKFKDYLIEAEVAMRGSLSGADSYKTISHVLSYVAPYLSSQQMKSTVENMGAHISDPKKALEKHTPLPDFDKLESTHVLAKKHGDMQPGEAVKATGAHIVDGKVMVSTAKHGDIPLSRLAKPTALKRERTAKKAWGLEDRIAANLGGKSAGSSSASHDFAYPPQAAGEKTKKIKKAKGVIKTTETSEQKNSDPFVKGETKGDTGVMGNAKFVWDKDKGWDIQHSNKNLSEHMKNAHVNGEKVLDYLNRVHSDGIISKGFRAKAPTGMTRKYFDSIGNNSVHIHDMDKDHGTTFTVGEDLKGKTRLGHLSDSDIDSMDGIIDIGKTQNGKTLGFHRPDRSRMRELAALSINDPENHRSLTNEAHAQEFMKHVDSLSKQQTQSSPSITPMENSRLADDGGNSGEHGGVSFHSPNDKVLARSMRGK